MTTRLNHLSERDWRKTARLHSARGAGTATKRTCCSVGDAVITVPRKTSEQRHGGPLDYGYGLQRIDAATAAAARRAPSAARIQVTSVGRFCFATSFGRSENTLFS